jgi:outer membrane immunogenic protein
MNCRAGRRLSAATPILVHRVFMTTNSRRGALNLRVLDFMQDQFLEAKLKRTLLIATLAALAVTPALAAKAKSKSSPPPPAPVYSWSGCYVGVNGGYGWNNGNTHYNDTNTTSDPINFITGGIASTFVPTPSGTGGAGGLGGGGVGCNWQSQQWVYGLEGDIDGGRIAGSQTNSVTAAGASIGINPGGSALSGSLIASEHSQLDWLSTIRGRIGLAVQDRLLLFATGGLSIGGVSTQGSVTIGNPVFPVTWSGSNSTTKAGYTAGFGGEWALADRWTARVEYLWYDLGHVSHALNCTAANAAGGCGGGLIFPTLGSAVSSFHGSIVRFGINYKFN